MRGEAGFSLVEVLAALAIASLSLVMAMQVMTGSARATARLTQETAASALAARLMAEGATGSGVEGLFRWEVQRAPAGPGLVRRALEVRWTGGAVLRQRLEAAP